MTLHRPGTQAGSREPRESPSKRWPTRPGSADDTSKPLEADRSDLFPGAFFVKGSSGKPTPGPSASTRPQTVDRYRQGGLLGEAGPPRLGRGNRSPPEADRGSRTLSGRRAAVLVVAGRRFGLVLPDQARKNPRRPGRRRAPYRPAARRRSPPEPSSEPGTSTEAAVPAPPNAETGLAFEISVHRAHVDPGLRGRPLARRRRSSSPATRPRSGPRTSSSSTWATPAGLASALNGKPGQPVRPLRGRRQEHPHHRRTTPRISSSAGTGEGKLTGGGPRPHGRPQAKRAPRHRGDHHPPHRPVLRHRGLHPGSARSSRRPGSRTSSSPRSRSSSSSSA